MAALGTAVRAAIAAELVNPGRAGAAGRIGKLLGAARVDAFVAADAVLAAAVRFREHVMRLFAPRRILVEWPLEHVLADGRVVRGSVDVLLDTDRGFIVIDHKSSPRPRSEWIADALEHSGQLDSYRRALDAAGLHVAECWIHFPVSGGLLRLAPAAQPDLFG